MHRATMIWRPSSTGHGTLSLQSEEQAEMSPSEGGRPCGHLDFGLPASRTWDSGFLLSKTIQLVVLYDINMCICLVALLSLTLCDPMDCSSPGSSVHGILQARILEWVAMPSSRGSSQPRDRTWVSCMTVDSLPTEKPKYVYSRTFSH